jgi:hypothetical protein
MDKLIPQTDHKPITVMRVKRGWVSSVNPSEYPKASFGDVKPFYAPTDITSLSGPDCGMIKLPINLYWGPDRWYNLLRKSSLREAYQTVLEEGTIKDIQTYINREVLLSIWNDLYLPVRLRMLWENHVKGMPHE